MIGLLRGRRREAARGVRHKIGKTDQVTWQACSILLSYPDDEMLPRLDLVAAVAAELPSARREPLQRMVAALRALAPQDTARRYVDTFDMKRRHTLYLTYFTAGDTRRRGTAMLEFSDVYKAFGAEPPKGELPDHLPLVLEFAATVDAAAGLDLLISHRTALGLIHTSLTKVDSPYADVLGVVVDSLPAPTDDELSGVRELARSGPPTENVGLEPFPLPMPTRRAP